MPDEYPIIRNEPATAAKVWIPTALKQRHDAVDDEGEQLGDVQKGTECAIGKQNLTGCSKCKTGDRA